MSELNEKLLKFAGFWRQELRELAPEYRHEANLGWWIPNSEKATKKPPNFPNDLNACFKWLVPKLDFGEMLIYQLEEGDWMVCLNYVGEADKTYSEMAKTVSEALCLAIEKLIDEGGK